MTGDLFTPTLKSNAIELLNGDQINMKSAIHDGFAINYDSGKANAQSIRFYDGKAVEIVRFAANGNVGIGTSSPSSKLHVNNGALTISENSNSSVLRSLTDGFSISNLFRITSKPKTGCAEQHVIFLPNVPYGLIDSTHTNETYAKAWIKWICTNYPGYSNTIFLGMFHPNSQGMCIGEIYSTSQKDSSGYPQYCDFLALQCANNLITFGFNNYTWYYKTR